MDIKDSRDQPVYSTHRLARRAKCHSFHGSDGVANSTTRVGGRRPSDTSARGDHGEWPSVLPPVVLSAETWKLHCVLPRVGQIVGQGGLWNSLLRHRASMASCRARETAEPGHLQGQTLPAPRRHLIQRPVAATFWTGRNNGTTAPGLRPMSWPSRARGWRPACGCRLALKKGPIGADGKPGWS